MSLDHLTSKVRRLMSEGKADRAIAYAINQEAGKQVVTRDWVRRTIAQIKLQDVAAKATGSAPAEVPFNEVLRTDPEAWAIRISARWRMGVEAIISTGKLLLEAKDALPHGAFGAMLEQSLPFKARQAQMLMAIASDGRLSNPQYVALLPPSWGTIYDVTRLSDDEFTRAVESGVIRPDMERRDIEQIRPRPERSSDGSGSPVADNPDDPAASRVQQGLATPATDGDIRDGGNVAKPERQPDVPDGSPVSPGPSETLSMPGGGLAIAHNRIEPSDSLDYFPTPPWATRALFEHAFVDLPNPADNCWNVWEPACGEGHMAEVLREYCSDVEATDIFDYGYGDRVLDFLSDEASNACPDWIITNPPFGENSAAFVERALDIAQAGVAMFVRLQWLEGVGRYERIFRDRPPTRIAFFAERVPLHKDRWEPDGGTMTAYIWLVWIKGIEPRAPFWIPPGCREALTRPDDAERFTQKPVAKRSHEAAEAAE